MLGWVGLLETCACKLSTALADVYGEDETLELFEDAIRSICAELYLDGLGFRGEAEL